MERKKKRMDFIYDEKVLCRIDKSAFHTIKLNENDPICCVINHHTSDQILGFPTGTYTQSHEGLYQWCMIYDAFDDFSYSFLLGFPGVSQQTLIGT